MKIPFDIKYRPEIESGKYKVENREGKPVRIICWDKKSEKKYGYHIVALIEFGPQHEESTYFTIDGKGRLKAKEPELFIITPEPELTGFEQNVRSCIVRHLTTRTKTADGGEISSTVFISDATAREIAKELLDYAKKELCGGCAKCIEEYWRGRMDGVEESSRPTVFTNYPYYPYCQPCTNPHHDCINCPRNQVTIGINTQTSHTDENIKANNNEKD